MACAMGSVQSFFSSRSLAASKKRVFEAAREYSVLGGCKLSVSLAASSSQTMSLPESLMEPLNDGDQARPVGSPNASGLSNVIGKSNAGSSSNLETCERTVEQRKHLARTATAQRRRAAHEKEKHEKEKEEDLRNRRAHIASSWTYKDSPPISLVPLEDFQNKLFDDRARKHLRRLKVEFAQAGMRHASTVLDAFNIVAGVAFAEQTMLVNRALYHTHGARANKVTQHELRLWFAETLTNSVFSIDVDDYKALIKNKIGRCGGAPGKCSFLPGERFREIANHVNFSDWKAYAPSKDGTFRDSNSKIRDLHKWARRALEESVRLFLTEYSVLAIDDWLSGLRALAIEAKPKGDVPDMICDVFFRYVIDVRHRERGHDAEDALRDTMQVTLQQARSDLVRVAFCADKYYVKEHMWRLLAEYNSGFVLICDPVSSTTGHPFVGDSEHCWNGHPPRGRIPQGVFMGDAIFHAVTEVPLVDNVSGELRPVYAYAVRTMKTVSTKALEAHEQKSVSEILAFFSHGTGMEHALAKTYVMIPQRSYLLPNAKTTLFVPERGSASVACQELLQLEDSLRTRVIPRTYSQRDAAWFMLRRFHITETVGSIIARRCSVKKFLSHQQDNEWQKIRSQAARATRSYLSQYTGNSSSEHEELCCDIGSIGIHGTDSSEDESCASESAQHLLAAQHESTRHEFGDVEPRESDNIAVAKHLLNAWFSRKQSTADVKKSAKGEPAVMRALREQEWIGAVWDTGLVAMKEYPWIAVSADGVVKVQRPSAEEWMTVTLKTKTKVTRNAVKQAERVRTSAGVSYWDCEVGSDAWYKSVPPQCRAQLIHQALVFGFDATLLVIASPKRIIYSVLVRVPRQIRQEYLNAMVAYKDVVAWAHDNLAVCCLYPIQFGSFLVHAITLPRVVRYPHFCQRKCAKCSNPTCRFGQLQWANANPCLQSVPSKQDCK